MFGGVRVWPARAVAAVAWRGWLEWGGAVLFGEDRAQWPVPLVHEAVVQVGVGCGRGLVLADGVSPWGCAQARPARKGWAGLVVGLAPGLLMGVARSWRVGRGGGAARQDRGGGAVTALPLAEVTYGEGEPPPATSRPYHLSIPIQVVVRGHRTTPHWCIPRRGWCRRRPRPGRHRAGRTGKSWRPLPCPYQALAGMCRQSGRGMSSPRRACLAAPDWGCRRRVRLRRARRAQGSQCPPAAQHPRLWPGCRHPGRR